MGSFEHEECMKIIQCDVFEKNIACEQKNSNCWEMARQTKDFRFLYNICNDCIVFLFAQEEEVFTANEMEHILSERNIKCYRSKQTV